MTGERAPRDAALIRPAQPGDAATIRDLVVAAYASYAQQVGRVPGPMRDDYERRVAACEVWVLERGGEIAGVIVLKDEPDGLMIDNVAVRPEAQGNGFGRALLAFAEREARRRGYGAVRLYANVIMVKNIAIYERLGFVEVERFRDGASTRIQMAKLVG